MYDCVCVCIYIYQENTRYTYFYLCISSLSTVRTARDWQQFFTPTASLSMEKKLMKSDDTGQKVWDNVTKVYQINLMFTFLVTLLSMVCV